MFRIVAWWHPLHRATRQFAHRLKSLAAHSLLPLRSVFDDSLYNFIPGFRIRMPESAAEKRSAGFEMQIEAWRPRLFPCRVREPRSRHRLIGIAFGAKTHITVNTQQRCTTAARIGNKLRAYFMQPRTKIFDELQERIANVAFIFALVLLKPIAVVVALELPKKPKEFGSEMRLFPHKAQNCFTQRRKGAKAPSSFHGWARDSCVPFPASEVIMSEPMKPSLFHPAVANWFTKRFAVPTRAQELAWPAIKNQQNTLIAAPTGSGKTLAAFLAAIDDLVRLGLAGRLDDTTHVVYVSPLKALSNDIQINLQKPLEGIARELKVLGLPELNIRTLVRTGDTPAAERTAMIKRPPHIIVTTPESLYILLTSEGGRRMLQTAHTLILDEIHAVVGDKRGSHLALSVERLEQLAGQHETQTTDHEIQNSHLVRIGLSATQRPIGEVARFLVGTSN